MSDHEQAMRRNSQCEEDSDEGGQRSHAVDMRSAYDGGGSPHATEQVLAPLIAEIRAGGPDADRALERLLLQLQDRVRVFVRHQALMVNRASDFVDDAVQRTLIAIWRSAGRCNATCDASIIAWVRAIARNCAISELREYGPYALSLEAALADKVNAPALQECADQRSDLTPGAEVILCVLREVTQDLAEDTAAIMWMRLIMSASWSEIAGECRTTATAAKRRYQRAQHTVRRKTRQRLAEVSGHEQALAYRWLAGHSDQVGADAVG